jgi:probable addiction module antidote protein
MNEEQTRNYHELLIERLRDNPQEAIAYLDVALEEFESDGDTEMLVKALRNVAEAQGGIPELARRVGMNRQSLYKALSSRGNPRLSTIGRVLHGLGYRLTLKPATDR